MTRVVLHQLDDEVLAIGPILDPDGSYYVPAVGDTTSLVIKSSQHVPDDHQSATTYAGTLVEDESNAGQWYATFTIPKADLPAIGRFFFRCRVVDALGNQQTIVGDDLDVDPGKQAQRASTTTAPVINLPGNIASQAELDAETAARVAADAAHAAAADPHPGYTTAAELSAAVTAAVGALVDGAPGALDTLNELAAALGDDANFAATVTAALAALPDTYVPLTEADLAAGTASRRTLGTGAQQAAAGNDARLSDARTPTAHAASHADGGADEVTVAESQVTGLTAALGAKETPAGAQAKVDTHAGLVDPHAGYRLKSVPITAADVAADIAPPPQYKTGLYYGSPGPVGNITRFANELLLLPLWVDKAQTFDRIALFVATAGSVGSVMRLGIYADTGSRFPGARVLDAGTVDTTTPGAKSITISQTLGRGLYWIGAAYQGGAATQPVLQGQTPAYHSGEVGATTPDMGIAVGFQDTPQAGALPTTFTAAVAPVSSAPRVTLRAA